MGTPSGPAPSAGADQSDEALLTGPDTPTEPEAKPTEQGEKPPESPPPEAPKEPEEGETEAGEEEEHEPNAQQQVVLDPQSQATHVE